MSQIVSDQVFSMEERGERMEQMMDIYESIDAERGQTSTETENNESKGALQTQSSGIHSPLGGDISKRRYHRVMAASLVLLCVIMLGAVIMLGVMFSNQSKTTDQLQTKYENLMLSKEKLQISNNNLTVAQNQLNIRYTNLTNERNQLQKERDELKSSISAMRWSYFNSSIYYMSMGIKNWNESQQDCKGRGADLVIINSKEEKDFIGNLTGGTSVWIGLTNSTKEGTWKWVDGSVPTYTFWDAGQPGLSNLTENCAVFRDKWYDISCSYFIKWICEKRI